MHRGLHWRDPHAKLGITDVQDGECACTEISLSATAPRGIVCKLAPVDEAQGRCASLFLVWVRGLHDRAGCIQRSNRAWRHDRSPSPERCARGHARGNRSRPSRDPLWSRLDRDYSKVDSTDSQTRFGNFSTEKRPPNKPEGWQTDIAVSLLTVKG